MMDEASPDYIPGTEHIVAEGYDDAGLLKDGDIILIPQPTISPNDPLNWPRTRKLVQLLIILIIRGVAATASNVAFAPAPVLIDMYPDLNWTVFDNVAAIVFASMGGYLFLAAPSVFLYGLRQNYLMGMLFGVIGEAWFTRVRTASDVYGSQFFVGISVSCTEASTLLSFAQVFYQHQVDSYLVPLFVFTTIVGMFAGSAIANHDVEAYGWRWVSIPCCISYAIGFVLVLLFLDETYFDREHFATKSSITVLEAIHGDEAQNISNKEEDNSSVKPKQKNEMATRELMPQQSYLSINRPDLVGETKQQIPDAPKSMWKRLALITPASNLEGTGFKQYMRRLILSFRVFAFPPVIFAGFQWGAQMSWLTFYMTLESDFWIGPPWNYTNNGIAVMFVPTLIGALIGFFYSIFFVKWFVQFMAKRNGGIREAEMRLWCIYPGIIASTVGLIVLGAATQYGWSWPAPYVMLGLIGFGFGSVGDTSMAYCIDCYPGMVLESMVGVAFFYDIICAVLSVACSYWLGIGTLNTMISIGVINFVIGITAIPMMYFGKPCRIWTRKMYFDFVKDRDSLSS